MSTWRDKLDALAIHPRDFARQKALGKTAADMTSSAKLVSQAKNYARRTVRDARGMRRAIRLRKNIGKQNEPRAERIALARLLVRGGHRFGQTQKQDKTWTKGKTLGAVSTAKTARDFLGHMKNRQAEWQQHGAGSRARTAARVGGAALGVAGTVYGVKAYRRYRKKASEKTKFRDFRVVKTAHGHVAVGNQVHNQPYYNEVEPRDVSSY